MSFKRINMTVDKPKSEHLMLFYNNDSIMSNSKDESKEHEKFWENATGDVLITGLGLGFCHANLINNPNITSVTIIEKYQEVIDLTWDNCIRDDRFKLIHADANTWEIEGHWNCIWIDHWVHNMSEDTEEEFVKSMAEKYGPHCDWLGFWVLEKQ